MNVTRSSSEETVFVGIPCYNRPDGLADTIRCLQQQTHQKWIALICDNASPNPEVESVSRRAAEEDSRIRYHRHTENIGIISNFRFAAMSSDQTYFMWASDDDLWHPNFMAENLHQLHQHANSNLSFGAVQVINLNGDEIYEFPPFKQLRSTGDRDSDIKRYLNEPEKLGKANLFYGLFRSESLKQCIEDCWESAFSDYYAGDYVFLFGFFCRNEVAIHEKVHFSKRQPTKGRWRFVWRHPRACRVTKPKYFESYVRRYRLVAPNVAIADLAESMLRKRQAERFWYIVPGFSHLLDSQKIST